MHHWEEHSDPLSPTGRRRNEPEFQDFPPPYRGAAGRAFQSFQRWLKNESFHQRGQFCEDEACRVCAAWRRIHQETQERRRAVASAARNALQDSGFDRGRQLACDALVRLVKEKVPYPLVGPTNEAKALFGRALRQGFLTVIRQNMHLFDDEPEDC